MIIAPLVYSNYDNWSAQLIFVKYQLMPFAPLCFSNYDIFFHSTLEYVLLLYKYRRKLYSENTIENPIIL